MRNIAIIEDEKEAANRLKDFLARFAKEKGEEFSVSHFSSAVPFLSNYRPFFDVVFMDIELPVLNGMEASRKLRESDKDIIIIFVTNMAQFAVSGYEVDALDFIVKPVSYANFALKFSRAVDRLEKTKEVSIWINGKAGQKRMLCSKLKYVEISQHVLIYHTIEGCFTATGSLKAIQEQLGGVSFILCNQCYLVNLKFVSEVKGFIAVVGGDELQISHPRKKEFLRALNLYINEGGPRHV